MDQELQKYYEGQFSMMATPGWSDLMEDLQKIKQAVNDISTVPDAQQLYFRKGQMDILDLMLTRKDVCAKSYEDLNNEENV
jgi:hypothetical protein